jgi:4-amino-4-deoxy-L-arabinose transferase-like glycosyltransferase
MNKEKLLFLLFASFLLFFHLLSFKKYPVASIDESWISSDVMAIVDKNFVKMDYPFFKENSGLYFFPKLILGNYYKIFGLGFVQGRLLILTLSFLLLFLFFKFTKEFFGKLAGILSVIYFASTKSFLFSSHLIRFDIPFVIFLLLSLWLFFRYLKKGNLSFLFLSGLIMGFSHLLQANGILFLISFTATWVMIQLSQKKFNFKEIFIFFFGVLIFWTAYIFFYILPNFSNYILANKYFIFVDHPFPVLSMGFKDILDHELFRYKSYFYPDNIIELCLIIISLLWALKSKNYLRKFVSGYVLISALLFFPIVSNKAYYYFIYLIPFASVSLILFFLDLWRRFRYKFILFCFFAIFVGSNYYRQFKLVSENFSYNYLEINSLFVPFLSNNSLVLGEAHYWLPLKDYRYANISLLTWYRLFENLNAYEALIKIDPDFIIVDPFVEGKLVEDESQISTIDFQRGLHKISKKQFERFLEEKTTLILSYNSKYYFGDIKLYKVNK